MTKLLVVLAAPGDPAPDQLAPFWRGQVRRLTSADLSRSGWRLRLCAPKQAQIVVDGTIIDAAEIDAVVTRQGWILDRELSWIADEDRLFVAAEMQAFLVAFLSTLSCPVINPPTPTCLAGPMWRPAQWRSAAARCGFKIATATVGSRFTVTVIGPHCLGPLDRYSVGAATRLSVMARAPLLVLEFVSSSEGPLFENACLSPDLGDPAVAREVCALAAGGT